MTDKYWVTEFNYLEEVRKQFTLPEKVHIHDVTLREGEQAPHVVMKPDVDLSITIESGLPSDPPVTIPKIDYVDHNRGREQMKDFFPGITKDHLPGGLGWAVVSVSLNTHSGTHLDAPYHYSPTMDDGKPSLTIDEIPLEWCFNDGVILDFRRKADGERITVKDVEFDSFGGAKLLS